MPLIGEQIVLLVILMHTDQILIAQTCTLLVSLLAQATRWQLYRPRRRRGRCTRHVLRCVHLAALRHCYARLTARLRCIRSQVSSLLRCTYTSPLTALPHSCQTYEGGLAASSQPTYKSSSSGPVLDTSIARPAIGEAHGGYAFCALASHLALSQLDQNQLSSSSSSSSSGPAVSVIPGAEQLNLSALLRWATSQQGTAYEGGGFRGRKNKLVDGCYGWFSGGGMFACLQVAVELQSGEWWSEEDAAKEEDKEDGWESDDGELALALATLAQHIC